MKHVFLQLGTRKELIHSRMLYIDIIYSYIIPIYKKTRVTFELFRKRKKIEFVFYISKEKNIKQKSRLYIAQYILYKKYF